MRDKTNQRLLKRSTRLKLREKIEESLLKIKGLKWEKILLKKLFKIKTNSLLKSITTSRDLQAKSRRLHQPQAHHWNPIDQQRPKTSTIQPKLVQDQSRLPRKIQSLSQTVLQLTSGPSGTTILLKNQKLLKSIPSRSSSHPQKRPRRALVAK
jgi:hypothetical protein